MSHFLCPACKNRLSENDHTYVCKNGHTYDKAKSGYVNLLLNPLKNSNSPGDNKLMVNARRDFLDKGYYSKLADAVSETICKYADSSLPILDVGCGEGYYTEKVYSYALSKSTEYDIVGIDISKFAVEKASKRCKAAKFAVASIFHMPFADSFCGTIINIFAPYHKEEFIRTLKKDGIFIMVIPGEEHLWELKKALYDTPYKNEVKDYEIEDFELLDVQKVDYKINADNNADLQNLFKMTPYCYKSPVNATERLLSLDSLEIQLDFRILVYRKK